LTDATSAAVAINDCLINVHFGDAEQPEFMQRVRAEYFRRDESVYRPWPLDDVLADMDAHGVRRAVVVGRVGERNSATRFVEQRPDRLAISAGGLDLLRPVPTMRALEAFVADFPVAFAQVGPSFWADGRFAPDHAVYYPLYAKCCELDLPLCINTGIPGPPVPAAVQHPIHLDEVCIRFPELKLCMIHGADPWWDVAIRLMIKYPNLHLMTSAWSPKRLPEALLHYMRTRGSAKVLFASDAPVLSIERTATEARALDLSAEVLAGYLAGNSQRLFFDRLDGITPEGSP